MLNKLLLTWILKPLILTLTLLLPLLPSASSPKKFKNIWIPEVFLNRDNYTSNYGYFAEKTRIEMREKAKDMFTYGYDSYMKYAFPMDELDPIHCKGRGPDKENPSNININDVLGDFSLTLIDSLDTLAVMGNTTEFKKAVKLVVDNVSFDKPYTIQVFEANIRVLGGLLSAHLLIEDEKNTFGDLEPDWYTGDLLTLAHDLADRLIMAFDEETKTGLPHPRINLQTGVPFDGNKVSCAAGAGSLILEFGMLSRLLGDPVYESYARRAIRSLWRHRNTTTDLFSNDINIETGQWQSKISGLGAGMDSFYEYLLKSHILFEEKSDLEMFVNVYDAIKMFMRRGRTNCNDGDGPHPHYVNVNIESGDTFTQWVDSLQAAIPGLQVLHGDLEEAICHHAYYYAIWKRFGFLPERYNWNLNAAEVKPYPLRPEFIESTYFLYQATKHPFYLHVGRDIISSLNIHTKVKCGYATVHDVDDKSLEDRQESFFLSETCKYLFLLFDIDNPINKKDSERFLFTTEGHVFPITSKIREKIWQDDFINENTYSDTIELHKPSNLFDFSVKQTKVLQNGNSVFDARNTNQNASSGYPFTNVLPLNSIPRCQSPGADSAYRLPIKSKYLAQLFSQMNVDI